MSTALDTDLVVDNVQVKYGEKVAVAEINFGVNSGETTAVIGPSGCGKSTTLKAVAGLNEVSEGTIILNGRDITHEVPPKRNIGLVPQSYAVFPHMSVRKNIGYGLRARGVDQAEIDKQVDRMLDLTQLTQFADRAPGSLSGGQRQRVALARALAISPEVLLLDEPLAALDPQLRGDLRRHLGRMIAEAGCGTLIVTHDQHEALALADNIAILREGRVVQLGTPQELWDRPVNAFVADFLTNSVLLDAEVSGDEVYVLNRAWKMNLSDLKKVLDSRSPQVLIRPTALQVVPPATTGSVEASVNSVEYAGGRLQAVVEVAGQSMLINTTEMVEVDQKVSIAPLPGEVSIIGGA